ncbi:hypothetical protein ASE63_08280 [Bosea sp. Root381]|uniref:hypothetical protein n=1 Tax=Bosea sp. Root381 TaxID=1736524 RepID=UPI0006FF7192|nr:hypothetical protein [Bosea sp. Root381]KRE00089.1 hypothetical protein ASE63_08280 [Bosea sp. Root381]
MLSAPNIYVPRQTHPAVELARRYRLRRTLQSCAELVAVGLFCGGVLSWSWVAEQHVLASAQPEPVMLAHATPTARPARSSVAADMADFITRHTASNGAVTRDDLLLDFTDSQIDEHLESAKRIARNAGKARR